MAAAAASTFAAAGSAEAEIHYSGLVNRTVRDRQDFTFPLAEGASFVVRHSYHIYGSSSLVYGGSASFFLHAPSGGVNGAYVTCAVNSGVASVSNLKRRDVISVRPFVHQGGLLATSYGYGCTPFEDRGQFMEKGHAFVGFKFNTGAGDQYGWAHLRMQGQPFNEFKLVEYAYGDPGERVRAGQKSSPSSSSAMGALGALALGATGLVAWRRQRNTGRSL